jgi:protein-tyrosine-phosphatase|nr:MAG TPA: Protein-tyrosine-phosphatase [Caudoviricetes sp.]
MKDNILVLCHSNMHRSPFVAEYIRNSAYGDAYEVRDAGLHVDKGQRVPKALQRAFQTVSHGSLKDHKSRQVSINDILWADKIIIMEPENKSDLLEMLGSMHLSDKPRYDRIVGKITSLAQLGGKQAVDDPHHYSPGTLEYGKVVLNLAYLANSLVELWETQRSWPETGKEVDAEAAAGPFGS